MSSEPNTVRLIRVFVSSPGDVQAERDVLDEVVASINRTDGSARGFRLELFRWEEDVVPQLGPKPQQVVDDQTPVCVIYLGIMSTRFGTPTGRYGSGTEKEFKDALKTWKRAGAPWITFYFDDTPSLSRKPEDVKQYLRVCEFRDKLESQGVICGYSGVRGSKQGFYEQVSEHLRIIVHRLAPPPTGPDILRPAGDPTLYLRDLREKTAHIDIRGLQVGTGKANRFAIEDLFISLTTTRTPTREDDKPKKPGPKREEVDLEAEFAGHAERAVPLHAALQNDRLVIVGDPGAGKTTFLRRVAHTLCQTQVGEVSDAAQTRLGIADRTFPVFVKLSEFAQHLLRKGNHVNAPAGSDSPAWLPHYLAAAGEANNWALDGEFFRQQLEGGLCTVLLDGLDEAPDRVVRKRLSKLIENATAAYKGCRFVITSRPAAYRDEVVLSEFAHARIDALSDNAVETFLARWCEAIYTESETAAQEHCRELLGAIQARVEIRRMARNPVMLTALAVVHWNERRLPEQRADLYESIIRWLSRSREQRPGRATADRTVVLLQELALAMQDDPKGRKTQVPKRWAAEKLACKFGDGEANEDTVAEAECFLDEEEIDSGVIVGRGNEVAYWHLTFQEFLAAKAIASRLEATQTDILFSGTDKVYLPDWREVMLLLAGALHQQGEEKVDWLIGKVLDGMGKSPDLAAQARCSGLIGNVVRDLEPLKYKVSDPRYHKLLDTVMAVFDIEGFRDVPVPERIAAADALGQAGDPRLDPQQDDYWATIPAGKFLMGAQSKKPKEPNYDKDAYDDEAPVHEVYLDSFAIARYPVTVGQYNQFVEDKGYQDGRWWKGGGFGEFSEPENWERQVEFLSRPVVGVSWWEAAAFCLWSGHRLPTEAEWERAARGTEARKYPWGNEEPDEHRMNFRHHVGHPTPPGIFPLGSTPDGILDMGGNVWEWCADWFVDYPVDSVSNPRGPDEASYRVMRGGSWFDQAVSCRSAYRSRYGPENRFSDLGFRVARSSVQWRSQEQINK